MARSFKDLEKKTVEKGICPRCELNETAGRVQVRIQAYGGRPRRPGKVMTSRSISLCEECCVEVYEILEEVLGGAQAR